MKLLKKLLTGAAVAVAALSMMSCGGLSGLMQKTFGEDLFYYQDATYNSGAYGKWTAMSVENESTTEWKRGMKMLFTKHSDISGYIELNVNNKANNGDGVVGLVFDITKNDDKTWNFGIVGIGYASSSDSPAFYVSHFYNISDEDMSKKNFGAWTGTEESGTAITSLKKDDSKVGPYEVVIAGGDTFVALPKSLLEKTPTDGGTPTPYGVIKTAIKITETNDGSYNINFYAKDAFHPEANTDAEAIVGTKLLENDVVMKNELIGKEKAEQAYVGAYGNVYRSRTFDATLEIACLTNDAIVAY